VQATSGKKGMASHEVAMALREFIEQKLNVTYVATSKAFSILMHLDGAGE
jgi:hypothetical protein